MDTAKDGHYETNCEFAVAYIGACTFSTGSISMSVRDALVDAHPYRKSLLEELAYVCEPYQELYNHYAQEGLK